MIILIVEKAISTINPPAETTLSPSAALKSLFTAISDGHIIGTLQNNFEAQMTDPCEKQFTDAIFSLTGPERKNLWASANYSLKEMNKNNLPKLLALEGSGIPSHQIDMQKKKKPPNNFMGHKGGFQLLFKL